MEGIIDKIKEIVTKANEELEQIDVHDDLEYGEAKGVIKGLNMAIDILYDERLEQLKSAIETTRNDTSKNPEERDQHINALAQEIGGVNYRKTLPR